MCRVSSGSRLELEFSHKLNDETSRSLVESKSTKPQGIHSVNGGCAHSFIYYSTTPPPAAVLVEPHFYLWCFNYLVSFASGNLRLQTDRYDSGILKLGFVW